MRTIVVFSLIMTFMKVRLRKRGVEVHLVPLLATKVTIVVLAAVAERAIEGSVSNPTLVIAAALFVAITIAGRVGDRFFFSLARRPEPAV